MLTHTEAKLFARFLPRPPCTGAVTGQTLLLPSPRPRSPSIHPYLAVLSHCTKGWGASFLPASSDTKLAPFVRRQLDAQSFGRQVQW